MKSGRSVLGKMWTGELFKFLEVICNTIFMVALCNRADHYIFAV